MCQGCLHAKSLGKAVASLMILTGRSSCLSLVPALAFGSVLCCRRSQLGSASALVLSVSLARAAGAGRRGRPPSAAAQRGAAL